MRDRQVLLGVGALGGAHDHAGFVAVQQPRLVRPLQRDAPTAGDDEGHHRPHEDEGARGVGDVVQVRAEDLRDDVVAALGPQHAVQRHHGDHEGGAHRGVARTGEQVVLPLVTGDPGLDEGVEQQDGEQHARNDGAGDEDVPADREAADVRLPAGHRTQQTLGDTHVPVGLGAGGHLRRVVGAVHPDRVDRHQATHEGGEAEDDEEEPARLRGVDRHHRVADDVVVGLAGAGPLGVLLVHEQHHVGADERQQQPGDEQDVHGVQAGHDRVAGELAAEGEERDVAADHGDRLHQTVGDAKPGAGQQVVGQRVAGEALQDAQHQQQAADHPVDLARLAEGAGEEHAHHVHEHRRDEEVRRPVVHLPQQQAAAHVEGDVQRRGVRLRHLDAAQLVVGAVVGHVGHAGVEPQRQEDAGDQQDHEAPQRDLPEHERPVVGEYLADLLLGQGGHAGAVIGPGRHPAQRVGLLDLGGGGAVGGSGTHRCHPRSQKLGPTGSVKSLWATR